VAFPVTVLAGQRNKKRGEADGGKGRATEKGVGKDWGKVVVIKFFSGSGSRKKAFRK